MRARALIFLFAAGSLFGQVTFDRIVGAEKEPQNWLTYSGSVLGQRYSLLDEITPDNVKNLELQWIFQASSLEKFEATSLVVDGVLYTVQAPNDIIALDAATGRTFWTYSYTPSPKARPCCGHVNRGLAILGNTLFMGTIDAHLVAVDAKNGHLVWDTTVAKAESGYALTHAPLIAKDKVIVGTAGGEFGIRGFIAAYDVHTGKEAWRFYTVAGPGDPKRSSWGGDSWKTGGAPIWVTGSYDPELNLTYWGTGNPGPDWNGDPRPGDNLYSDSVVALDADTGELKWFYQFSPHDEFDHDSVQIPVLADIEWPDRSGQKKLRKLMLWANRNGMFYVLDRSTGEFLSAKPFAEVNWVSGFDELGRPIRAPGKVPTVGGSIIAPGSEGATNWYSPSFSQKTGLFYVSTWDGYSSIFFRVPVKYTEGRVYAGGWPQSHVPDTRTAENVRTYEEGYGAVRAIDPLTGQRRWEFKMNDVTDAGVLSTASNLVFSGGREGYFFALDARSGELLWKATLGGVVASGPMTYSVNGRQYVAVAAGHSLFSFALRK
ncbi:MAG: PQQ-dependent dehydrogenase, methanol/ethanol family [Bryobacterales bacterium]|nr:PQQ-dependent dehydrogenase, methanol/ethanol family [Bryobacterales bacterium]